MFNKLINDFLNLFQYYYNEVIIIFLLILTAYWIIRYDIVKLLRIRNSFSRLIGEIETIKGIGIENMKRLDELFGATVFISIRDIWFDYYNDFRIMYNKEKAPDINRYFNLNSVITITACRKKADVIHKILIMLGILGVLLVFATGLPGVELTASGTIDKVSMNLLFNIVASALRIAIAAVMLSVIFQVVDKHFYQSAIVKMNRFIILAARKLPMTNEAANLELLLKEQRNQNEEIQNLGSNISSQLSALIRENLVPTLTSALEDAVKTQIAPSINIMSDMLNHLSQKAIEIQNKGVHVMVESFIDKLNNSMGTQFQALGRNLQGMLDRQEKAEQSINKMLEELLKSMNVQKVANVEISAVLNVISEYHKQVKDINATSVKSMEQMLLFNDGLREVMKFNKKALEELNNQRLTLEMEKREYYDTMGSQVPRLMEDLSVQLDSAFSRFNDITSLTLERMEKSIDSMVEGMNVNMKSLFNSMDDQVRDISLYAKGLSEEVNELNGKLESSVKEFSQQMSTGVISTLNSFDSGLSEICSRFGNVITDIRDAIEDLPAIVGTMRNYGKSYPVKDRQDA